jgi:predicted ATPase
VTARYGCLMTTLDLTLKNFRTYEDVSLELGRMSVLVGPNGVGKTSILVALHILSQLAHKDWAKVLSHERSVSEMWRRESREPLRISVTETLDIPRSVWLTHDPSSEDPLAPLAGYRLGDRSKDGLRAGSFQNSILRGISEWLPSAVLLRLNPTQVARPSPADSADPRMRYDGAGLASVLAHMKLRDEERFDEIVQALRRVVPSVRRIRPVPVEYSVEGTEAEGEDRERVFGYEIMFDMVDAKNVRAPAVSEGTLLALALFTMVRGPRRPRWILLDDIGQALHPLAQADLVSTLREMVADDDGFRIVATTHSPFIVDAMAAEDVWVVGRGPEGASRVASLGAHPGARKALTALSTGEFWSAEGEDWVAELAATSG